MATHTHDDALERMSDLTDTLLATLRELGDLSLRLSCTDGADCGLIADDHDDIDDHLSALGQHARGLGRVVDLGIRRAADLREQRNR